MTTEGAAGASAESRPKSARPAMRPHSPYVDAVREHMAARAHGDAYETPKKAALRNGVSPRTARRWRSPREAKGSPQDQYSIYLAHSDQPWRLVAANKVTAEQKTVSTWTDAQLIARYRELLIEGPHTEAVDTANASRRGVCWLDRATDSERDAAHDVLKAAIEREFAVRRITEEEVFES